MPGRAPQRWGRGGVAAVCLLLAAPTVAQTVPDSVKTPSPTFVVDTARHVVVVSAAEPTNTVTRRTGLRIGAAIVVLTLTTLLLYNVRSR